MGMGTGTWGQHKHKHWDSYVFFSFFLFILLTINLQANEAYILYLPPRHIQPQGQGANDAWHNSPLCNPSLLAISNRKDVGQMTHGTTLRAFCIGVVFFSATSFYATHRICGGSFYMWIIVLYCSTYVYKIYGETSFKAEIVQ